MKVEAERRMMHETRSLDTRSRSDMSGRLMNDTLPTPAVRTRTEAGERNNKLHH